MYCLQLGNLKWYYATAQDAWDDRHLDVRKNFQKIDFGTGVITGVRNFKEFVEHLENGAVLQFHALRVYKCCTTTLYLVRIAGKEWTYSSAEAAWCSEHVKVRAYTPFEQFVRELNDGKVWSSGDVMVWKEPTPSPND